MCDWYLFGCLLWLCNILIDVYFRLVDVNGLLLSFFIVIVLNYKYYFLVFIYFLNIGFICFRKVYEDNYFFFRMLSWNILRLFKFFKLF